MGLITATADDDSYGKLMALVSVGDAKFLGERYDSRGVKQILVDSPGYKANPQIGIGREFFTTALRDYGDWQEKWWREAVQNAVDAGATEVWCAVRDVDGAVEVTCTDNGGGMDEGTLLNKFLVLGGTSKVGSAGTTGGFGKAKELLVLPWLSWSVHTRSTIVDGSGIQYETRRADSYIDGTKLTVLMPRDQATHASAAMSFIGKCDIARVKFYVDGELVKAEFKSGEHIRDFADSASLFHNKKKDGFCTLLVRANGIFMFGLDVSSSVQGSLVLELTRPSVDLLTANRDGFRSTELRQAVSGFVNILAADTKSALRKKKGFIREKFKGTGKFSASSSELRAELYFSEGSVLPEKESLSDGQIQALKACLGRWQQHIGSLSKDAEEASLAATPALASAMLSGLEMAGSTQVDAVIKQLSWEPDFFIVNEIEGFRVPKQFYPKSMSTRIRQLLRYWAEVCRFILIQLGSQRSYGVGFIFDKNTGASYIYEDGEHWLMLNPFGFEDPEKESLLSLSSNDDLAWLYAAAVHECTHIADGIHYHEEAFASAMTRNVAKTANRTKQLKAIKAAIVKR